MTHCQLKMERIDDFVMKLSPFLANFGYYNTDACSVVLYTIKSITNNVHTCIVLLCCPNSESLSNLYALLVLELCQYTLAQIYSWTFTLNFLPLMPNYHTKGSNLPENSVLLFYLCKINLRLNLLVLNKVEISEMKT